MKSLIATTLILAAFCNCTIVSAQQTGGGQAIPGQRYSVVLPAGWTSVVDDYHNQILTPPNADDEFHMISELEGEHHSATSPEIYELITEVVTTNFKGAVQYFDQESKEGDWRILMFERPSKAGETIRMAVTIRLLQDIVVCQFSAGSQETLQARADEHAAIHDSLRRKPEQPGATIGELFAVPAKPNNELENMFGTRRPATDNELAGMFRN